jgi:hypothetical protein
MRCWTALIFGGLTAVCTDARALEPAVNYMLQCMGCHTPDGRGEPGRVPSVRETLRPFASAPAGRKFLVQVPGSAQSKLSDAELADVLNWMIANLSVSSGPSAVAKYTAAEVALYRRHPLVTVGAVRKQLMADLSLATAQ